MKQFHTIAILLSAVLLSCDRKPVDQIDVRQELNESGSIQAFDRDKLIGEWVLTYRNGGMPESNTAITFTFDRSGEFVSSQPRPSGLDDHKNYWHLAHLEGGETILLMEGSSLNPEAMSKVAEFDGPPMIVRIDQEKMEWFAFGRKEPGRAAPTDIVLFRFEKAE